MTRKIVDYEEDFFVWTIEQARLLRAGDLSAVYAANIAEKIESLGRSDRRELGGRLTVLVAHLLRGQKKPAMRSKSWSATIRERRRQIDKLLRDSPSLRLFVAHASTEAYGGACKEAAKETELSANEVPAECPFTL
jgi:Domain of unknown function DUF29